MSETALEAQHPLFELITGFISQLRDAGIPIAVTETMDALEAVKVLPLEDREAFKYGLGATLVKNEQHWKNFETLFDVYFAMRSPESDSFDSIFSGQSNSDSEGSEHDLAGDAERGFDTDEGTDTTDDLSEEDLSEMIFRAMMQRDGNLSRAAAREAVQKFAGMEAGRPVGGTYYLYRTLRNLELDSLLERMIEADKDQNPDRSDFDQLLANDELEALVEQLKAQIEAEIRRRLVADRGVEAMAKTLRKPLPEDLEFMHAGQAEMETLGKAIEPLTRKLAIKLARKRRHRNRGGLDFRNTIRKSLSYGGVPAEPVFKHKKPSKPEVVVLADISGSVAAFARFTLHLVYAMSGEFSKVRSFVFIDGLDEVTEFFDRSDDMATAIHRVNTEANVIAIDGHSDYGHAFDIFEKNYMSAITSKTTVLILGDARNNYHTSQSWVVQEIQDAARQVFWMNPEPRAYWDSGDSIVSEYAEFCDDIFEVRNLRQLEAFVEAVL